MFCQQHIRFPFAVSSLLLLVVVFFANSAAAQPIAPQPDNRPEFKSGELLCAFAGNTPPALGELAGVNGFSRLTPALNWWLVNFDEQQNSYETMAARVMQLRNAQAMQRNHYTSYRKTPNDLHFNAQQHLSIIQAAQAWDYTTGGFTRNGDTIVIAVVDDGIDTLHPDLIPNIWINHAERPWDGIDNDSNGYIDDFRGWNIYDTSGRICDEIEKGRHGTSVAGIIGARANNSIGVAGINWNIRLMIVVAGGSLESQNIAAYGYILSQKQRWIGSRGATVSKGAMVCAINTSWGIDRRKPASAPLWCAFYDTMGKYGILNVAATTNGNDNVDLVGDLPTSCPSDYLLTVTNTLANDAIAGSGYGSVSIDVGAPGEESFSTVSRIDSNKTYGMYDFFSGTSGSAPIVTGIAGLMMAHACDSFLNLHRSQPAAAVKVLKQCIMAGTDKRTALLGKTVSGGRVNARGALQELDNWCWRSTGKAIPEKREWTVKAEGLALTVAFPDGADGQLSLIDMSGRILDSVNPDGHSEVRLNARTSGIFLLRWQPAGNKAAQVKKVALSQ